MSGSGMLRTRSDSSWRPAGPADRIALVLAGGKSLGAFEAGAYQALHEEGVRPDWIVGSSIGAINGAIIAGNPVERRLDALQGFWSKAAVPSPVPAWAARFGILGELLERSVDEAQAMLFGSPAVFRPNPAVTAGWVWPAPREALGLYDLTPLRHSLEEFADFDFLNRGEARLTAVAVDLETGEEALFDSQRQRLGPEHIMASGAMLGEFPPVEIGGRLYVDGGLRSNLPVDVVRAEATDDMRCFAVDLFSAHGRRPRNMIEAVVRRQELLLVASALQYLEAQEREDKLRRELRSLLGMLPETLRDKPEVKAAAEKARRPEITVTRVSWTSGDEIGVNTYDWSDRVLAMRWEAGMRAASEALHAGKAPARSRATTE